MPLAPASRARLQASLACVGTLTIWLWRGSQWSAAFAITAGTLALIAWTIPTRYAPIQRGLDRVVHGFLMLITWFVLAVVYLFVFTPLRIYRSLTGRDALARSFKRNAPTYFTTPPASGRYDRQF
jgi:hypothetical protein